jgi:hypothetical protein
VLDDVVRHGVSHLRLGVQDAEEGLRVHGRLWSG